MRISIIIAVFSIIFSSCANKEMDNRMKMLVQQVDSISTIADAQSSTIILLKDTISTLRDSLTIVSYPAADRLAHANQLYNEDNLDAAESEIIDLCSLFPNSQEAKEASSLTERISQKREQIRLEKERIAALGFKAIPQTTSVKVGYNTISLSNITTGTQFTFDAYGDEWYYRTADRGSKYVTMAMSVTSTSHDPELPEFAVYSINGSTMHKEATFKTEYARWSSYGHYLGNYTDKINDFSKVSTVRFKLGAEVDESVLSKPYAIVMYNDNVLVEGYDRFKNPPQFWIGGAPFANILDIDSFQSQYVLIKTFNLR